VERACTAELFFARLKRGLGLDRFLLRGLDAARCEFQLAALAHNLQRLRSHMGKDELTNLLKASSQKPP